MTRDHVFVTLGVGLLVLGFAVGVGCSCSPVDIDWGDFSTVTKDGVRLSEKDTLRLSSPDKLSALRLDLEMAKIVVEGDPAVVGVEAEFEVRVKSKGDAVVAVAAGRETIDVSTRSGEPSMVVSARIRVPPSTPIEVSTDVGSIEISGIKGVARVSATSDMGRIELRKLEKVAEVRGKSDAGSVSLADSSGLGEVSLETDAGAASLKAVADAATVRLKSDAGSVRVEGLGASTSLICESDAGSVKVVDVRTGDARLSTDLGGVTAERSTFDHLYAHTSVGAVRLRDCTYKTKDVGTDLGSVSEK
jgi:hypothetical protein